MTGAEGELGVNISARCVSAVNPYGCGFSGLNTEVGKGVNFSPTPTSASATRSGME
jgi:hypothetical protein